MINWRDTQRPVRFGPFDGRAAIGLIAFLLHMQLWTLIIALTVLMVLSFVERRGLSVPGALRWVRSGLAGKTRPAAGIWRKRYSVYYLQSK